MTNVVLAGVGSALNQSVPKIQETERRKYRWNRKRRRKSESERKQATYANFYLFKLQNIPISYGEAIYDTFSHLVLLSMVPITVG